MRKLYPFHGESLTIYAISRRLGFVRKNGRPSDTFARKVKLWGYDKALELAESGLRADRDYVCFGNVSKPLTDWCRVFGMKDTTVFSRIKQGWEVHVALTVPAEIKHVRRDDSLSEIARRHHLKMGTVWARRNVRGWSETRSLEPINEDQRKVASADAIRVRRDRDRRREEFATLGIIAE